MPVLNYLSRVLLSDLPEHQRWSYFYFSLTLLIALGSYQFLYPVKQSIFLDIVGTQWEPVAKSTTLVVLIPVLIVYSMLVSWLRNPVVLVATVCGIYAILFLLISLKMLADKGQPPHWLAWVLYYATETRAVIVMPMIWSVLTDVTSPAVAKIAYPAVFCAIQIGGILGSLAAVSVSSLGGELGLLLLQAGIFVLIALLNWRACVLMTRDVEVDEDSGLVRGRDEAGRGDAMRSRDVESPGTPGGPDSPEAIKKLFGEGCVAGLARFLCQNAWEGLEGLWLLLSRPYVFMAFWVSYATLVPRTVLDYQNSVLVVDSISSREEQVEFWGRMGMIQNCLTAALALLGTRPIVEMMTVGRTLLVLPITILLCVIALCIHHGLWVSVWSCIIASALAYGLNSPCKEIIFVRTSSEIKYKAKSWSEMYGNQLMKLLGAQINLWINNDRGWCTPHCFKPRPTLAIMAVWVIAWLGVAYQLGNLHAVLEKEDRKVS